MTKPFNLRQRLEIALSAELDSQGVTADVSRIIDVFYVLNFSKKVGEEDVRQRLELATKINERRMAHGITIADIVRVAGYDRASLAKSLNGRRIASLFCLRNCEQALESIIAEKTK